MTGRSCGSHGEIARRPGGEVVAESDVALSDVLFRGRRPGLAQLTANNLSRSYTYGQPEAARGTRCGHSACIRAPFPVEAAPRVPQDPPE